jgi:hypothetical protein
MKFLILLAILLTSACNIEVKHQMALLKVNKSGLLLNQKAVDKSTVAKTQTTYNFKWAKEMSCGEFIDNLPLEFRLKIYKHDNGFRTTYEAPQTCSLITFCFPVSIFLLKNNQVIFSNKEYLQQNSITHIQKFFGKLDDAGQETIQVNIWCEGDSIPFSRVEELISVCPKDSRFSIINRNDYKRIVPE